MSILPRTDIRKILIHPKKGLTNRINFDNPGPKYHFPHLSTFGDYKKTD